MRKLVLVLLMFSFSLGILSAVDIIYQHYPSGRNRHLDFSADGRFFASCDMYYKDVLVREVRTGRIVNRFPDVHPNVLSPMEISLSPDGSYLAVLGKSPRGSGIKLLYGVNDEEEIKGAYVDILSKIGNAPLHPQYSIRIYDCSRNEIVMNLPATGPFLWSDRENSLVYEASPGKINILNFDNDASRSPIGVDRYYHDAFALSPDGKILAGSSRGQITFWNFASGRRVHKTGYKHRGKAKALAFGEAYLASGGDDETVKLWDLSDFSMIYDFDMDNDDIEKAAISPDGRYLVAVDDDPRAYLWEISSGKLLFAKGRADGLTTSSNLGCWFSRDSKTLMVSNGKKILWWRIPEGEEEETLISRGFDYHMPTNKAIMRNSKVRKTPVPRILSYFAGADRRTAFIRSGREEILNYWDLVQAVPLHQFHGTIGAVSSDGKTLAIYGKETIRFYHSDDFSPISATEDNAAKGLTSICFSRDGRFLYSVKGKGNVQKWEVSSGRLIHEKQYGERSGTLTISPDGQTMLISHTFTSIVDLGKEAYIEYVLGDKACFSADGRYFFTADTTGRVIRYKTPEVGDEIEWKDMNVSYSYGVRSLSTHPEGGQLIIGTCYTRGKVDLYDLEQHEISRSVDGRYSAIRGLHFLGEGGAFLVVEDPSILVYRESRSGRCAAISLAHTQIGEHFLGTEDGRFHYSPGTEETAVIRDGEKIFTPKERPDLVDHSLPERLRTLINSSP